MLPRTTASWVAKEAQMRADAERKALEDHMGSWIPFHSGQLSAQCWLYALEIETMDKTRPHEDWLLVADALLEWSAEGVCYEDVDKWLAKRAGAISKKGDQGDILGQTSPRPTIRKPYIVRPDRDTLKLAGTLNGQKIIVDFIEEGE